jgi:hypothetical protein
MSVNLQHCARAWGKSCIECVCRLPDEAGWAECPAEARGIILPRQSMHAPQHLDQRSAPVLSGELCQDCGMFLMIRTGTCMTCQSCGSTSGGCS